MNDICPAPSIPALRLRLYGNAQVLHAPDCASPAQAALSLRGRAAGLVALVTLEPGIRRERLAELLWPDAANPRQALRQQLLRFRQQLGQPLITGSDTLHLAATVLVEAGAPGAELLAGEPTPGDDFGLWLSAQRRARQQSHRHGLLNSLAASEESGERDAALAAVQALLALDPHDESHRAALMRVHLLRGECSAGLAAYQALSQDLAARLGTRPAPGTQALETALRKLATTDWPVAAGVRALPATLKRPPVMVGRADELAAVAAAWRDGMAVLVEGEAGMGKSRLLSECLARQPGLRLQGAGRPGDSGAPYSTLARLLQPLLPGSAAQPPNLHLSLSLSPPTRRALRCVGAEVGAAAAASVTATADAAAADAGVAAGAGAADAVLPADALPAGALPTAVAELLGSARVGTVALDDLHFADSATLELVSGLVAGDTSCRWLFAQRPAEGPAAAAALRQALAELRRLAVVTLKPLDSPATAELLDALALPGLHAGTLAPLLVQHGGGNPLFMIETIKQGLQDGSLVRGALPRPASVGALIQQRLQRLSPAALTLARVAAIAGVDFNIELAEATTGDHAVQLASAWQELQDAQLLRDESLAHDLVADAVLHGVPPVVARRVHAQCAAWLAQHSSPPARAAARVAKHWRAGGQPEAAARAFEQAARQAREAARQPEEAEFYAQAAQAYADAGQPAARFEALAQRVSALIDARSDAAALAEARALFDDATSDLQRVRALRVWADQQGQRGPFEEAVAIGQRGMTLARSVGAQEELVRLTSLTAGNQIKIGRTQEAYGLMLALREWVDREAGDELRQIWYGYWAAVLGHMGRLREGVAAFDVSIGCAERTAALPNLAMDGGPVLFQLGKSSPPVRPGLHVLLGLRAQCERLHLLRRCRLPGHHSRLPGRHHQQQQRIAPLDPEHPVHLRQPQFVRPADVDICRLLCHRRRSRRLAPAPLGI